MQPNINYIWGLQEASVVAMADGYASASGRPGFVNLHTAGGLGHAMGALINAQVSNTPLVVTAGQQDMRYNLTYPLLSGDLVKIAVPVMKWAREIVSPDQIPVLIRRAFHDSTAAPSGPVFLSLSMNVMEQSSTIEIVEASIIDRAAVVAGSLDRLSDMLAAVKPGRLALIAGDEIPPSGASAEAVALAEAFGAPVFGSSWPAHIPFATAHPLWRGNLPTKASEIRTILDPFDAVFALGEKSLITILYSEGPAVPPGCKVLQLSADVRDLGRTYATELSCLGDIKASLSVLLPMLECKLANRRGAVAELNAMAATDQAGRRAALSDRARSEFTAPVTTPFVAACKVVRAIGPQLQILDEAAATMVSVRSLLDSTSPRQYSACRGGGLGLGMPAAVGWSLELDRQPVVSLVGDSALMYSPGAMDLGVRKYPRHLHRHEQPRIQYPQKFLESITALSRRARKTFHRDGHYRSAHRLSGPCRRNGHASPPRGTRHGYSRRRRSWYCLGQSKPDRNPDFRHIGTPADCKSLRAFH